MFEARTLVRITLLALTVLVLWALFAQDSEASGAARPYVVQPGDTLWSIAVAEVGGDPREAIWKIERRNHLPSATIVPGQRLVLPS
jgi:LysM repeat protein